MKKLLLPILILMCAREALACSISISSVVQNTESLILVSKQPQVKQIASVLESCAEPSGYILSISSLNSSKLRNSYTGYPYQISYDNEVPVSLADPYEKLYLTPSQGVSKRLDIVLPPRAEARAGVYFDTITVSISAR